MATSRMDGETSQEFQLETRHLVLIVALVIVLCVASFLLGRWVERQNAGPVVAAAGAGSGDPNITEMGDVAKDLTFFDTLEGNQPAPLQPKASPARAPVNAEVVSPKPARPTASSTTDTRSSRRSVNEGVMIQVFASKDRAAAEGIRRRLRTKGYTALLVPEQGTYKVRVGPYADREEAERAATTLRDQEKLTTWIP